MAPFFDGLSVFKAHVHGFFGAYQHRFYQAGKACRIVKIQVGVSMFKRSILLFASLMFCHMANAAELGLVFGFNYTEKKSSNTGVTTDSEVGFQAGGQFYKPLENVNDRLYLRTGGVATNRVSELAGVSFELLYLDIPATLEYRLNERVGFFGGLQLLVLLSRTCSPSNCQFTDDAETFVLGLPLGVNVMVTPEIGFDFFYQIGLTEMWGNIDWNDTIGAQFIYKFDI